MTNLKGSLTTDTDRTTATNSKITMSACYQTAPREIVKGTHIIYGSKQNLSGKDVIHISSQFDHPLGPYGPKCAGR